MTRILPLILCLTLVPPPTLAGDVSRAAVSTQLDVLSLAPADPLALFYVSDPAALLDGPLQAVADTTIGETLTKLLSAWQDCFKGSAMLSLGGPILLRPDAIQINFAAGVEGDPEAVFDRLENRLLPQLTSDDRTPMIQTSRAGDQLTVRSMQFPFIGLHCAVLDGVFFASTTYSATADFQAGKYSPSSFRENEDFKQHALAKAIGAGSQSAFVYVNLRPLLPMFEASMEAELRPFYEMSGIADARSLVLGINRTDQALRVGIEVAVADETEGLWSWIAPGNRKTTIASMLPDNYVFTATSSMTNASEAVDVLLSLVAQVAPDVVDEYEDELQDVTREFGFAPQREFLANFVEQWAVGLDFDEQLEPRVVLLAKLADDDLFLRHFQNLVTAYRLPIRSDFVGDIAIISRADEGTPGLALAVFENHLVVSNSGASIVELMEAQKAGKTLSTSAATNYLLAAHSNSPGRLAFLNFRRLAELAAAQEPGNSKEQLVLQRLQLLGEQDAKIMFSASRQPELVSINLTVRGNTAGSIARLITESIVASLQQARYQSQRLVSMANIKGLMTTCLIYANDNDGWFPDSMKAMVESGDITLDILRSPYDGSGPSTIDEADTHGYYLYRSGVNVSDEDFDPAMIVIAEPDTGPKDLGANFGFADGHVEWIEQPRAGRLIAELRRHAR